MNSQHYPSLELCKKLTEIWFPTTFQHIGDSGWTVIWCGEIPEWMFVSPSVMEMLDVIPWEIKEHYLSIVKQMNGQYDICYQELFVSWELHNTEWTLPNALAQMILWLHENKYISFN